MYPINYEFPFPSHLPLHFKFRANQALIIQYFPYRLIALKRHDPPTHIELSSFGQLATQRLLTGCGKQEAG